MAARALANQSQPYSVCTILRDEEIYKPLTVPEDDKTKEVRSRYNGRLFLSWLQDVDDKWEKIKVSCFLSLQFHEFLPMQPHIFAGTNGSQTSQRSGVSQCSSENGLGMEIDRDFGRLELLRAN